MTPDRKMPFFFSVEHITKPYPTKLIYGVRFIGVVYYFMKSIGLDDCVQLDGNPVIDPDIFANICLVITEIENEYKRVPPVETFNLEIHDMLVQAKNPGYDE